MSQKRNGQTDNTHRQTNEKQLLATASNVDEINAAKYCAKIPVACLHKYITLTDNGISLRADGNKSQTLYVCFTYSTRAFFRSPFTYFLSEFR